MLLAKAVDGMELGELLVCEARDRRYPVKGWQSVLDMIPRIK